MRPNCEKKKKTASASQMTESLSIAMMFVEIITVYSETRVKHMIRLCGKSAEILKVAANGTYNYHYN